MSRVPRIRFKGFEEDWEQRKLGEIGNTYSGLSGKTKYDFGHGQASFITYMNVYSNPVSRCDMVEPIEIDNRQNEVEIGDVFFTTSSETPEEVGMTSVLTEKKGIIYLNSFCFGFRPFKKIDKYYLAYMLRSKNTREKIILLAQGISRYNISKNKVMEISVELPSFEEQILIGKKFKLIDHLITLHQRKLEKLKIIKKSMLENLFPQNGEKTPKIRFSEFTNDWEQRKWIDVVDISKNMVDPRNGKYDNLPHISPGNIESFTGQLYDNVKCVKDENLISGKFKFSSGDIIYGKINPQLGKYLYATFSGLTSADAYVLNAKNEVNQKYLYTIIQTRNFFEYSVSVSMRSGMPKINRDELNVYSFFAPATDEQLKIGNCILKYDHLITLHQSKLEKLQKIKKSMLESMFV